MQSVVHNNKEFVQQLTKNNYLAPKVMSAKVEKLMLNSQLERETPLSKSGKTQFLYSHVTL